MRDAHKLYLGPCTFFKCFCDFYLHCLDIVTARGQWRPVQWVQHDWIASNQSPVYNCYSKIWTRQSDSSLMQCSRLLYQKIIKSSFEQIVRVSSKTIYERDWCLALCMHAWSISRPEYAQQRQHNIDYHLPDTSLSAQTQTGPRDTYPSSECSILLILRLRSRSHFCTTLEIASIDDL